jgi:hypothetical protein
MRPGRTEGGHRIDEARMELENLAESLGQSLSGDPWHGPSMAALLADVTPEDAMSQPVAGAHSIIDLVLHLAAWTQEVGSRLRGNPPALPALGTGVTVAAMLAGLARHDGYHGGQIAILKRALAARRANETV